MTLSIKLRSKISSKKQLPSNNGLGIIIYKYTKRRVNINCKESTRQLLKQNYKRESYHDVLGINTYS